MSTMTAMATMAVLLVDGLTILVERSWIHSDINKRALNSKKKGGLKRRELSSPFWGWTRTPSANTSLEFSTIHSLRLSLLTHSWRLVVLPVGNARSGDHIIVSGVVSAWHRMASLRR